MRTWRTLVLTLSVVIAILASGCEARGDIYYINETDEVLFAEIDDRGRVELPAGKRQAYGYVIPSDETVTLYVTDANGCLVVTHRATFRELDEQDFVIKADDLPPPGQRIDCDAEPPG